MLQWGGPCRSPISLPASGASATTVLSPGAAEGGTPLHRASEDVARVLRPLLPDAAFAPTADRLPLLLINAAILVLGWWMAAGLHRWPSPWQLAFLPFALLMGNSVIVLLFSTHDLLHGIGLRGGPLRRVVGLLGLWLLWMPPTLWQAVHNREHHGHTNALADPDRSYLEAQTPTWGKWIQHQFTPSDEVRPWWLAVGMASAWGVHNLRTIASVLLCRDGDAAFPPAAFRVSWRELRRIALELLAIVALHGAVMAWLQFNPLQLLLGYFLPIWIGYAGAMGYIYTNHLLCPLTEENEPLVNCLSLQVPALVDLLHLNFSHHTEHHLFPGLNSSYYPQVRRLLQEHYGDRYQVMGFAQAWRLLLTTPRHYRDACTLVSQDGRRAVPVPLGQRRPATADGGTA